MKGLLRQPAEGRRRADAADRGAADRGAAAAPRPAGPARIPPRWRPPGDAIFSNLGLLFAIGVAVGLARENHGAAGLAARGRLPGRHQGRRGADRGAADGAGRPDAAARASWRGAAYKAHELAKLSVPVGILSGLIGRRALQPLLQHQPAELPAPSSAAGASCRSSSGFAGLAAGARLRHPVAAPRARHGRAQPRACCTPGRSGCSPTACSTAC